jgi:site-specific DNA recombinase
MTTKRFVALARVSSREQEREGFSLAVQADALMRYAAGVPGGGEIVKFYRIAETASKSDERRTFRELIEYTRANSHKVDGLLFYKIDRAARNLPDYVELERLESEHGVPFISVSQPTENNPAGRMMRRTLANMASFFTEQQSVDVREGLAKRAQEGWFVGMAPYGYRNVRRGGRGLVEVDPVPAANVRRIFKLFATGDHTLDSLIAQLHAEGLRFRPSHPKFPRNSVRQFLLNPAYCGMVVHGTQIYEGKHEPLVTKALFDRVHEVLHNKSKPHSRGLKPYLYRGLFRCGECGCFVTTETQKGHNYLHCTKRVKRDCSQRFVREEQITAQITEILRSVAIPADDADWMLGQLATDQAADDAEATAVIRRLRASLSDIQQKLERLADLYTSEGLQMDEYASMRTKLLGRKRHVKDQLASIESNPLNRFEPLMRFVSDAKQAGFLATSGTDEQKRDLFRKTGSNLQLLNRELRWEPRDAWQIVQHQSRFVHKNTAASVTDAAVFGGEISHDLTDSPSSRGDRI